MALYPGAPAAVTRSAVSRGPLPVYARQSTPAPMQTRPGRSAPVRRPATRPVSQSVSQVANQRVNAQLQPQVAAQNQFNQQQDQAIQGFANALLGKLGGIPGQVGQAYDTAIGQQAGLSNQAAQFLQSSNPSPAVQALLQSAGAPQSQQAQIASQLGQTFGGGAGVLSFLGGAVPSGQLAADKAAMVGQAAQLPGFAALKAQQDLASALATQGQNRATLEATRPGLYQQAAQDIRTNNAARAKAAYTAQQDLIANRFKADTLNQRASQFAQTQGEKASEYAQTRADKQAQFQASLTAKQKAAEFLDWYRTQGVNATNAKINQKAQEFGVTTAQKNAQIAIEQQNANTSATRANNAATAAAARQATADARLKVAQRHEAAYERSTAAKIAKAKAAKKGISPTTYAGLRKQALAKADLFYYGKQPSASGAGGIPGIDYGSALKQLMDGYSLTRKDAAAILNDFYAPGERGRPKYDVNPRTNPNAAGPPAP